METIGAIGAIGAGLQEVADESRAELTRALLTFRDATVDFNASVQRFMDAETRRLRILVLDDDPGVRKAFEKLLPACAQDVEVESCGSSAEALAILRDGEFDLLIVDLNLDGSTGMDFATAVRRSSRRPLVPIVIVTGERVEDLEVVARVSGANAFLRKPFEVRELSATIHRLVPYARPLKERQH